MHNSAKKGGRTPSIWPKGANLRVGYLHAPGGKGVSRLELGETAIFKPGNGFLIYYITKTGKFGVFLWPLYPVFIFSFFEIFARAKCEAAAGF